MPFKCAGQAHGALEILQIVELHVDVDMVQQTPGGELGLLVWHQAATMSHSLLEGLLEVSTEEPN